MNAIIVCRITNNDTDKFATQLSQQLLGRAYCTKKKMEVLRVINMIEPGTSASKRSAFYNMIDELVVLLRFYSHGPLNLVVKSPDRLSRKKDDFKLLKDLEMTGRLKIHYFA